MFRVVAVQFGVALCAALVAGLLGGRHAAFGAILGGAACVVPNAVFAGNMAIWGMLRKAKPESGASAAFGSLLLLLLGEFAKLALTGGILVLIAWSVKHVNWPALIGSVCAVLLAQPFAMAWRR